MSELGRTLHSASTPLSFHPQEVLFLPQRCPAEGGQETWGKRRHRKIGNTPTPLPLPAFVFCSIGS